jgi:hypothetical protein
VLPLLPQNVLDFFDRVKVEYAAITFMSDEDITKICEDVEPNTLKRFSLKVNLQMTKKAFISCESQSTEKVLVPTGDSVASVVSDSKKSLFGAVTFNDRVEKTRDTNK